MNEQELWEEYRRVLSEYLDWMRKINGGEIPFDTLDCVEHATALAEAHRTMYERATTPLLLAQARMADKNWYVPLKSITPTQVQVWLGTPER
jgi:hypothetical protein